MGDPRVWDERYANREHASERPSPLLTELIATLPVGRALDVASGAGRHTIALASRGWQVVAIDGSRVGMDLLWRRLDSSLHERVTARVIDLEAGPVVLERDAFDLVVVFYYLNRGLFSALRAAVKPGGHIALAIHCEAEAGPKLLAPRELRAAFGDWEIAFDRERPRDDDPGDAHHHGTAELIARRPAAEPVA